MSLYSRKLVSYSSGNSDTHSISFSSILLPGLSSWWPGFYWPRVHSSRRATVKVQHSWTCLFNIVELWPGLRASSRSGALRCACALLDAAINRPGAAQAIEKNGFHSAAVRSSQPVWKAHEAQSILYMFSFFCTLFWVFEHNKSPTPVTRLSLDSWRPKNPVTVTQIITVTVII